MLLTPPRLISIAITLAALAALGGCASPVPPLAGGRTSAPAQWYSPLPHGGSTSPLPHGGEGAALTRWWQQFDDPVLVRLIDAAQAVSPTVASAASRIEQSRASVVSAGAALAPTLDAAATALHGRPDFVTGVASSASVGVQAAWELDLFGARRDAASAAQARLTGTLALWHDARVAVAAEVATRYAELRSCEAQVEQASVDAASRVETSRLTALNLRAGFEAPANAALARASAAQGNSLLTQRRAQCEVQVKGLVALTGLDEPALRVALSARTAQPMQLPVSAQLASIGVPAQLLVQRPDLLGAERELIAAAADVSTAQAQRYPRIALNGALSAAHAQSGLGAATGALWTIGPLTVALPLFDGGVRRANVDAAAARYREATALYQARLRSAVREVEEALVALQSSADRNADALLASEGFAASFRATDARRRGGLASLFELEDARRQASAAQVALIDLQRERTTAWIALYRALGGGWSDADLSVISDASDASAASALRDPR